MNRKKGPMYGIKVSSSQERGVIMFRLYLVISNFINTLALALLANSANTGHWNKRQFDCVRNVLPNTLKSSLKGFVSCL